MKTNSPIRIIVLIVFAFAGFILTMGEEITLTQFILDKILGFVCFYATYRLYGRWRITDNLVRSYDRWINDSTKEGATE